MHAAKVMAALCSIGQLKEKCDQIHLDTGTQRHDAHKLYLNRGFKLSSFHMAAKI